MNQNDDLDTRINDALEQYLSTEPLAGMEQRIVNRVRLAAPPRRTGSWKLLAACSVSVFICIHLWPVRVPPPLIPPVRAAGPAPLPSPQPMQATAPNISRAVPRSLPRKPIFLVPAPFTPQERALLSLVENHPEEARQAFADLSNRTNQPIEIPPIEVPLLSEDGSTPKEN
jgi:hypothetical protein